MGTQGVSLGLDEKTLKTLIYQHKGNVNQLSKALGVQHSTIWVHIAHKYPHLRDDVEKARDLWDIELIAQCEEMVQRCVNNEFEDPKLALDAAKFAFKSKGKKRKWDVAEDDNKKSEGAMVDKMKSMEVVE